MGSLRRLARMCRDLTKQHVDEPDVPAAPKGAGEYAEWVQIALILYRAELEKTLRETEHYLNEMSGVLTVFGLDEVPNYSTFCRCVHVYRMLSTSQDFLSYLFLNHESSVTLVLLAVQY